VDWSGFAECKQSWFGIPIAFAEVSFGPIALEFFAGIYYGLTTGGAIWMYGLYFEGGYFSEKAWEKLLGKSPGSHNYWSLEFEFGVGVGGEGDTAESEFSTPGVVLEAVMQLGPLIWVKSEHGWALLYTPKPSVGLGVLVSIPKIADSGRLF